ALRKRWVRRRCSRAVHSASTNRPKRSSKCSSAVTVRPRPSSASTVGRGTATARLAEERLRAGACPAAIGFDPLPAGWRWYWERQVQDRDPLTLATSAADRDDLVSGGEIHFFDSDRHAKNHGFEWDGDILLQHRKESDPLF